jgi:hypothetical protein
MATKKYYMDAEIALHLLPYVIARQIRKVGDKICRISVRRTHWYHYNVTIRTKSIIRELATVEVPTIIESVHAAVKKPARKSRGCAA